jgi:uncharacterized coiled-coil protein SlyX
MELSMVRQTNDDENEVGTVIDKVPHLITALIAIGGLIAAYFMTIGDFRMKDMELSQRVTYLEQKVSHIEQTTEAIKSKLDSRIPVVDEDRQNLRREIDNLKDILTQIKPYLKK